MAATTAHTKQTLHETPALIALGEALHFLPHHTKPFRRRHILFLAVTIAFVGTMVLELGAVMTRRSLDPRTLFTQSVTPPIVNKTTVVRSSNGFAFSFNNEQFTIHVHGDGLEGSASDADLKKGAALSSVLITPLPSHVPAPEAAAEFEIVSEQDAGAFATFKSQSPAGHDIATITADYFAPKPTNIANIALESRSAETLGGTSMIKSVYVISPKFAGNPTHAVVWSSQIQNKPFSITVRGIVVGAEVPTSMAPLFASLKISSDSKVEGLSTLFNKPDAPVVDQKYVADMVSPAVVKIYHLVCGTLVYNGEALSSDTCSGATGSGFIVSSDGYIATNGHVVVYTAKDLLANALLANSTLLNVYLKGTNLTDKQIAEIMSRPELTASAVAKVYDLSDSDLTFMNKRELTVVALGSTPLEIKTEADAKRIVDSFDNTEKLKRANVVGYDYSSKDQLTVISDPKTGFSASDVALLKVDAVNLPIIRLNDDTVTQNQKISVFGFPGDADNELTDNTSLGVSVTNGSISSIREAAGGEARLYQSDVDASHGSSGGPAIDEHGKAIGLLTYRYASGESADAAKSYIRDIGDFKKLLKNKNVTLNTESKTQLAWERGLDAYSKRHYSVALQQFKDVQQLQPAHRLVQSYIDLSKQAINEGKDIKEPSILLLMLGTGAGLGGLALAVIMIARHHGKHKVYRAFHSHGLVAHAH
jgi:S1-C subfamily serine protease